MSKDSDANRNYDRREGVVRGSVWILDGYSDSQHLGAFIDPLRPRQVYISPSQIIKIGHIDD